MTLQEHLALYETLKARRILAEKMLEEIKKRSKEINNKLKIK